MRNAIKIIVPLLVLAGCQSVPTQGGRPWPYPCTDRAYDAGLCEQPSNLNLFGYIIGAER